ncbi:MAG: 4Fe-4S dicluster domain-containing protein [Chlorobi bacterium]|nr:4Fe-4S dicluster domain-containing protein [Chlorobiota bacterium]
MINLKLVTFIIGVSLFILLNLAAFVSLLEKEKRASIRFFLISWPGLIIFLLPGFTNTEISNYISLALIVISAFVVIIFVIPLNGEIDNASDTPLIKHDERDTMFSRNELIPDTEKFNSYYNNKPQQKLLDDKFRVKPGLLSSKSANYDPVLFASAEASFYTVSAYRNFIDGEINNTKTYVDTISITGYIKNWSKKLGAVDVGVTELKPYHLYSVKGRREKYGKEIINYHKYAIALTVEMDKFNIDAAPNAPTVFESAQQYLSAGTIAVQIAKFIRELGYPAKAHIDGNYEVVCPLVARDAGLGEIGRMGLLMVPKLGPRVRIAVITTDLPLVISKRKADKTVAHFCEICKKCAANCPSKAISFDKKEKIDGIYRWKINAESCFTYWCSVGTDCGKCIKACPYAHPNNLMHNLVRKGIKNNFLFRYLALYSDDFFYGKKPPKGNIPKWMQVTYNEKQAK